MEDRRTDRQTDLGIKAPSRSFKKLLVRLVCQVDYPIGVNGEVRGSCVFHGGGYNQCKLSLATKLKLDDIAKMNVEDICLFFC